MRGRRRNLYYAILLAALLAIIYASYRSLSTATAAPQKPLGDLLTALDQKQVSHGTFDSGEARVDWTDTQAHEYRTFYPTGYESVLVDRFHESQASIDARPAASNVLLAVVLPNAILILLIGGFIWYMFRRFPATRPPMA